MAENFLPTQEITQEKRLPDTSKTKTVNDGLSWPRLFGEGNPYDQIKWEIRDARISKGSGEVVFEQKGVEVPDFWSQTATDIVASKYFRGRLGSPGRESSAKQMVNRVSNTISHWGLNDGYFKTYQDYLNFRDDLKYLLINQDAAFNSPVWFNVGVDEHPQASACFILSVEDTMRSILEWYHDEGLIFKGGSGSGINLSKLRSSKEQLSRGGYSSGPVSFMKGADGVANSIRSGGATRRAAKMVVLNADHPDIKNFIYSKKHIEDMTKILEASGIKASIEGEVFNPYTLLPYQNANNSVRVTDDLMHKVETDDDWELKAITTKETLEKVKAREVMTWIADAAWQSADPGMQFDTTINDWHTLTNTGPITASNPCSEYMSIDNSACNLASINVLKFLSADGSFDVDGYKKAIDTMITAQEIIVSNASYPTEKITQNSKDYRQLGLGYANLGALLMSLGLPYDSDEGRGIAAALTAILCGQAYFTSAKIAQFKGPFTGYEKNREPMLRVIRKHTAAAENLIKSNRPMLLVKPTVSNGIAANGAAGNSYFSSWLDQLFVEGLNVWRDALALGEKVGYRNSQTTVIAPTGTIAFIMDCQTTGIEPELALIKYKKLVGGGVLKLINNQVAQALRQIGYSEDQIKEIVDYIMTKETIEGAPYLKPEHLVIFDCSFRPTNGIRSINYLGHIKMMGAVQPFVSGAISKTVNLPAEATVEDVKNAFIQAWKHGLKAIAIYRDGSKTVQPLNTSASDQKLIEKTGSYTRRKLPDERPSITHKFSIGNHEGYLTVGFYPDTNKPGETFITIAKEGSTISGLLDIIATLISMSLQSGVPLKTLVKKFKGTRFEPMGATINPEIPFAKSFIDYIFCYLGLRFLPEKDKEEVFGQNHIQNSLTTNGANGGNNGGNDLLPVTETVSTDTTWEESIQEAITDAPVCECGTIMIRAGSCFTCPNCFATSGVCN